MIPKVAIHVSERTQGLEELSAEGTSTPTGDGTSGKQWWYTSWHYFVMHESLKEALTSDGTPFVVVSDSEIENGDLLEERGSPKYPIVISLASEAIDDNAVAPLRDYVQAGGFLFVGSSAFTRRRDGTTRGDFALADEMGLHLGLQTNPKFEDWWNPNNTEFQKIVDEHSDAYRLVSHIPPGLLEWNMPLTAEQIPWGLGGEQRPADHFVLKVKAAGADVIANGSKVNDVDVPLLTTKDYGKGRFIYHGAFQPLIGHGGLNNGMYSYVIYRRAIAWAFEAADMPIVKLSPWRYPYNAAFVVRHDFENWTDQIKSIKSSAKFEYDAGAKGDYYFCTGVLREGSEDHRLTEEEKATERKNVLEAVTFYKATIGSHNGGLPNPVQSPNPTEYLYWHWGPDEALTNPPDHPNGKEYAKESIRKSFEDLERWSVCSNGRRVWASPFFNSTREDSYDLLSDSKSDLNDDNLKVLTVGEQKCSPFPHWTVSTRTAGTRYSHLTLPVSEWYVGTKIAQGIGDTSSRFYLRNVEVIFITDTDTLRAAVNFYYSLGALINIYSHLPSKCPDNLSLDDKLPQEYVTYCKKQEYMWATNSLDVYEWWVERSKVTVEPSYSEGIARAQITGATDVGTAVEVVLPNWNGGSIEVLLNGATADPSSYRLTDYGVKVPVGTTISDLEVRYTPLQIWTQTDWVGGPGQTLWSDATRFDSSTGIDFSITGQVRLSLSGGGVLFSDDFTRTPAPQPVPFTWTIPPLAVGNYGQFNTSGGMLNTSTSAVGGYGFAYPAAVTVTDHSVEADVRFRSGAFGGGITGRLNAADGQRYAAWIYPDGSSGGENLLKLVRFTGWTTWTGTPILQISLPSVGTDWHHLKMTCTGNRIRVYYDNPTTPVIDTTDSTLASGYAGVDFWTDGNTSGPTYNNFVVSDSANNVVFSDDFGPDSTDQLLPWSRQLGNWAVTNGVLQGSSAVNEYAYVYYNASWTDYTVEGRVQFPARAFGGGIGGRVDPASGVHYGAWVYPDGSGGGSNVLKLIKFRDWTTWSGSPMHQVNLPSVGTDWHTLKLDFAGNHILVWYDGNQVMDVIDDGFDGRPAYLSGGVSVDLFTQTTSYEMCADDIVVRLRGSYGSRGTLLSSAFDGGVGVQWHTIAWDSAAGGSTDVRVRTRTADSANLLDSAPWSAVYPTSGSAVTSANKRWIQYELELTSSDATATPNFYEIRVTSARVR